MISKENKSNIKQTLGGGFKYFYFHPYLGKIPILTNIFSDRLKPPTRTWYSKRWRFVLPQHLVKPCWFSLYWWVDDRNFWWWYHYLRPKRQEAHTPYRLWPLFFSTAFLNGWLQFFPKKQTKYNQKGLMGLKPRLKRTMGFITLCYDHL